MTDTVNSTVARPTRKQRRAPGGLSGIPRPNRTLGYKREMELIAAIQEQHGIDPDDPSQTVQREHVKNAVLLMLRIEAINMKRRRGEHVSDKILAALVREQHRELEALNES
jgi:hypothetical protein